MVDHETLDLFDELYYSSYDDVLKYVIIHCSSAEDAKDIVQNVYLEVLKKLKNGETKIERSYIFALQKIKLRIIIGLVLNIRQFRYFQRLKVGKRK